MERYLAGAAIDMDMEGFRFVRQHAYLRDGPQRDRPTGQLIPVWKRPFELGGKGFLAEGFADLAGARGKWRRYSIDRSASLLGCRPSFRIRRTRLSWS